MLTTISNPRRFKHSALRLLLLIEHIPSVGSTSQTGLMPKLLRLQVLDRLNRRVYCILSLQMAVYNPGRRPPVRLGVLTHPVLPPLDDFLGLTTALLACFLELELPSCRLSLVACCGRPERLGSETGSCAAGRLEPETGCWLLVRPTGKLA